MNLIGTKYIVYSIKNYKIINKNDFYYFRAYDNWVLIRLFFKEKALKW